MFGKITDGMMGTGFLYTSKGFDHPSASAACSPTSEPQPQLAHLLEKAHPRWPPSSPVAR